jgi:hypothetical protein
MREEISDPDDYVDWIQWVFDAEKGKQPRREPMRCAEVPALLQLCQVNESDTHSKPLAPSSNNSKVSTR